ncbi:nitrogen fixation protein NifQ [Azospirillum picis]|uniref:Nitrogen fixation protein NifQ n=1 Tax=Azospirillum picis TaxID=488438 RepID=A0ABU0MIN4_9PROT|nr:nitrogen fixation protein NifQ [Azospirillum picis]MBP2299276.1 nitrogen fixation protein NifQ [Azospirillum picis]MDQ0533086.1 nitrogen fixation protein NifQ [Azospirillum picis]
MMTAHARLMAMSRLDSTEDARDLSGILLHRCSAGSACYSEGLGLTPQALGRLLGTCFPAAGAGWTPGTCFAAHMRRLDGGACPRCRNHPAALLPAPIPPPPRLPRDEEAFRDLLLRSRDGTSPLAPALASLIARAAVESDHLWCSLGLAERPHLAGLLARHFPALAAANTGGLRWKRFFYERLWAEGRPASWETICDACAHYGECYGDGHAPPSRAATRRP